MYHHELYREEERGERSASNSKRSCTPGDERGRNDGSSLQRGAEEREKSVCALFAYAYTHTYMYPGIWYIMYACVLVGKRPPSRTPLFLSSSTASHSLYPTIFYPRPAALPRSNLIIREIHRSIPKHPPALPLVHSNLLSCRPLVIAAPYATGPATNRSRKFSTKFLSLI